MIRTKIADVGRFFNYFVIYMFRQDELKKILASRKGSCKQCGNCCRNAMNWGITCPFLKGNLCRIHKLKKYFPLKAMCGLPPYNSFRVQEGCGYYWEEEPAKK